MKQKISNNNKNIQILVSLIIKNKMRKLLKQIRSYKIIKVITMLSKL